MNRLALGLCWLLVAAVWGLTLCPPGGEETARSGSVASGTEPFDTLVEFLVWDGFDLVGSGWNAHVQADSLELAAPIALGPFQVNAGAEPRLETVRIELERVQGRRLRIRADRARLPAQTDAVRLDGSVECVASREGLTLTCDAAVLDFRAGTLTVDGWYLLHGAGSFRSGTALQTGLDPAGWWADSASVDAVGPVDGDRR